MGHIRMRCYRNKSGPAFQKTEGFKIEAVMRRDYDKAADYAKDME
jgi:hypothetical protein